MTDDAGRHELAKLIVERSYLEGDFLLSSGRRSRFYFECQATTSYAPAMPLIGRAFAEEFRRAERWPDAVGGTTRGADPIAQAIAFVSLEEGRAIHMFSVRKEKKGHGTGRWIEGCVEPGARVAVVDDVVTTGGSVIHAIERSREEGLTVIQVVVLVDREGGALERIAGVLSPEVPVSAIFRKSELDRLR